MGVMAPVDEMMVNGDWAGLDQYVRDFDINTDLDLTVAMLRTSSAGRNNLPSWAMKVEEGYAHLRSQDGEKRADRVYLGLR
jgi:hypothetical protein